MMGWIHSGHGMWGYGWHGGLMSIFFWLIFIGGIALFIRALLPGKMVTSAGHVSDPETILKERYAKGEIGLQEYKECMQNLSGTLD